MIFCLQNSCVALLNRHEGKCKVSVQNIISELSWDMLKFSLHFSDTFLLVQKLSHHELVCPSRIQKFREFLLLLFMEDFEMFDDMILQIIVSFLLFFHYWKIKKRLKWGIKQKYKLFKLLATSIALFLTSAITKK